MNIRDRLKKVEGVSKKKYQCPSGHWTIGVGHNIDVNGLHEDIQVYLRDHGEITDEMVESLLTNDIAVAQAACLRLYPDFNNFSLRVRDALLDFVFNVGEGTAKKFVKANQAINSKDWRKAAEELQNSVWFKQVGIRALDIINAIRKG